MKQKSTALSVALNLIGTIIGAGVFGLPAVFRETGILGGSLLFAGVLFLAVILHLLFVDVIYSTHVKHRIPGYIGMIFGPYAYWLSFTSLFFKMAGTILAYIILGGEFLSILANNSAGALPAWFWSVLFWFVGSFIVFYGLKLVTRIESNFTGLLLAFMVLTVVILFPFFNFQAAEVINPSSMLEDFGIVFFAVMGLTALPDIVESAGHQRRKARTGVILGVLIAGILSWLFAVSIALAHPAVTGVRGIQLAFPPVFWWLIPSVGLLAVITSFITMSQALKNTLHIDHRMSPFLSWLITISLPLLLYIFVSRNFLNTIGFVGGVLTVFTSVMVSACAFMVLRFPRTDYSIFNYKGKLPIKQKLAPWYWRYIPIPVIIVLLIVIIQNLVKIL